MGMRFMCCLSAAEPTDPRRAEKESPRFLYNKTNQMHHLFHPGPARKLSTNLYDIHQCRMYSK